MIKTDCCNVHHPTVAKGIKLSSGVHLALSPEINEPLRAYRPESSGRLSEVAQIKNALYKRLRETPQNSMIILYAEHTNNYEH